MVSGMFLHAYYDGVVTVWGYDITSYLIGFVIAIIAILPEILIARYLDSYPSISKVWPRHWWKVEDQTIFFPDVEAAHEWAVKHGYKMATWTTKKEQRDIDAHFKRFTIWIGFETADQLMRCRLSI